MPHFMKAEKKQFVRNIQECIIKPLLRQRETGELCDVNLKLNARNFNAHKAIVSLWSPYFLSMFTCDMLERSGKEVDLTESLILDNDSVFGSVLDYMYTGSIVITLDNIEDVLRIADFLLLDDVKDFCRQFYLDLGNVDLTNCLKVRFLAENHNLTDVQETCQKIIESRFHDYIIHKNEILEVSAPCFLRLVEDPNVIQHSSYDDLRKLVRRWVDHEPLVRACYNDELLECIKLFIYDAATGASYLGKHNSCEQSLAALQGSYQSDNGLYMFDGDETETKSRPKTIIFQDDISEQSQCEGADEFDPPDQSQEVLFGVVCNQGLKFLKIIVYNLDNQRWYHFPLSADKMLHAIPSRQTVCNLVAYNHYLYMYLCSSFPYPTDMLKINILVLDLITAQPTLYSFRTADCYNPCYRTTLTNQRSVPPVMVFCSDNLYVVGNKEGTGHLFMCNLTNYQYTCYQVPGTRFISLARAVVKDNRYIYVWFRHRTGPSEEFCIKKSVGFAVFDSKTKIFNSWEIVPPDINYDDFSQPFIMCLRDGTVLIYMPGRPALILDETRCKWVVSMRKMPMPVSFIESCFQSYGYQLQASTENSIFILNNELPYATSLYEVIESFPHPVSHTPPPIDHISMVSAGNLPSSVLRTLSSFDQYDDSFTATLSVTLRMSDTDADDSNSGNSEDQDSDNQYEYDDEIYDYDFGFNF